jgi:hypothetical protein
MNNEKPDIGPLSYPDSAILNRKQLADWLQCSEYTVKDWPIPRLKAPGVKPLFSAGMVLAYLEGRLDQYLNRAI